MRCRVAAFALVSVSIILSGCDFVDKQVLAQSREFFPKAEIHKYRPDFLHIETHVGNLTRKFAERTFRGMVTDPSANELRQGMQLAGYRFLVLGFDDYNVLWDIRAPQVFWVMDARQWTQWYSQNFGAPPASYPIVK